MSSSIQDTHAGGVVRVQYPAGSWGSVPHDLLKDKRLSLDTRGLAAWLATRPPGWQISISFLRREHDLGEERWQRMAREMERAGYLTRGKKPGGEVTKNGRTYTQTWVWEIVFQSVPPVPGLPGPGSPEHGKPGHKNKKDQTKKQTRTGLAADPVDNSAPELKTPTAELDLIRSGLGLSKGQLGKLAAICKAQKCKLQDVHGAIAPYLQAKGLNGQQAFLYCKRCILENPGRDWAYEARRRAAEAEGVSTREAEKRGRAELLRRLSSSGTEGIELPLGKGRITQAEEDPLFVYHHAPDADGSPRLVTLADVLSNFPSLFAQS